MKARFEYLRALRYELRALPRFDQVQVCTPANRDYLLSLPAASWRRSCATGCARASTPRATSSARAAASR